MDINADAPYFDVSFIGSTKEPPFRPPRTQTYLDGPVHRGRWAQHAVTGRWLPFRRLSCGRGGGEPDVRHDPPRDVPQLQEATRSA